MNDVKTNLRRDGKTIIAERVQDVEPILESNKALASENRTSDWGRHVATIPNVVLEKWLNDDGIPYYYIHNKDWFTRWIRKKLKDPENRFLRTHPDGTRWR